MLEELKQQVWQANLELVKRGLVIFTWGNVSGVDRERGLMVIKPSGVQYDTMKPEDMVVVDLESERVVEGKWNPSSDTATHLELYRLSEQIHAIAHSHSVNAVAFAQAGLNIPALGTTHADYFYGDIPCTGELAEEEVKENYERNTGRVIVSSFQNQALDPLAVPGILVKNHGPFSWGDTPAAAVYHMVVMETVAEMALKTLLLKPDAAMPAYILDKHYQRKHGPGAYYGQNSK